jgi:hypothetical protein
MKPFTAISAVIFAVIGVAHLLRLFLGWKVIVAGFDVPGWWSAPGFIIACGLAFMLWREAHE